MEIEGITGKELANWLEVTKAQRERQKNVLSKQFGENSAAVDAVREEITKLSNTINNALKSDTLLKK